MESSVLHMVTTMLLAFCSLTANPAANDDEWTLARARTEWSPMVRPVQHVGVPGFEFQTGVMWDGALVFGPLDFLSLKVMQEEMKLHHASPMHVSFGYGEKMTLPDRKGTGNRALQRSLVGKSLPIPLLSFRQGDVIWQETVSARLLSGREWRSSQDVLVADARLKAAPMLGMGPKSARVWIHFGDTSKVRFGYKCEQDVQLAPGLPIRFDGRFGMIGDQVRFAVEKPSEGELTWHERVDSVVGAKGPAFGVLEWRVPLEANTGGTLHLAIPYGLLDKSRAEGLLAKDADASFAVAYDAWSTALTHSHTGQITVPDPWINDYIAAVPGQMAQQVAYRNSTDTWMYKTSPNHYEGYWPCNAAKALPTLDYRGLTKLNEKVLAGFIKNQTDDIRGLDKRGMGHGEALEGEGYAKVDGFLGNFGEWTANPLLISHGLGMWALAQHYRITRDAKWLKTPISNPLGPRSPLEAMIKAFDWVSVQRKRTMHDFYAQRPAHYGLLPPASAHDWLAGSTIFNDAWCIYGMTEVVRLLREIKHSRADGMAKELADYREALAHRYSDATAAAEQMLREDGSYLDFVPRMVSELDWRKIDWTYTGYGPVRAAAMGALDPQHSLVDLSLKFLEEGMPKGEGPYFSAHIQHPDIADINWGKISDPNAPRHWLWRHYVEYETMWPVAGHLFLALDDLPKFFEFLFNNLAVAVHKDWKVGVESLDGVPSCAPGDSERWQTIRRMFVNETGGYDGSAQSLFLLQAMPREWLKPGAKLGVKDMGTAFGGKVDLDVTVARGGSSVSVSLSAKAIAVQPKEVLMRLRSGSGRPLKSATVNGKAAKVLTGDRIHLPKILKGEYRIVGRY
ncbi:MAG: hypothetical protein HZC36_00415 [Armatimonadetes bacterium]|nr:hypothetical protein [Armatimonadota bacterium]